MKRTCLRRIASGFRTWTPLLTTVIATIAFRSAIADWNDVPTGSMLPTIMEGDRIVVNKLAYGLRIPFTTSTIARWGAPERGDIVVFMSPENGKRLVKRVIGLPGDTIEMKGECLIINGQEAEYSRFENGEATDSSGDGSRECSTECNDGNRFGCKEMLLSESFPGDGSHVIRIMPDTPALRTFGPVTVPEQSYLMLGDNRDNSADSRYFGFVLIDAVVGRATHVAFSLDYDHMFLPRKDRFAMSLYETVKP